MRRIQHLDGIRGLAAGYVMLHHIWYTVYPTTASRPGGPEGVLLGLFGYGHYAVTTFIVLSGYSLAISAVRAGDRLPHGAVAFIRGRFRRIVIPYWVALVLSALGVAFLIGSRTGSHWDTALPVTRQDLLGHLFLVQDLTGNPYAVNHALWSIAVEWHLYALFPALLWSWRRYGVAGPTLTVTVASAVGGVLANRFGAPLLLQSSDYLGCFGLGAAACWFVEHPDGPRPRGWAPIRRGRRLLGAPATAGIAAVFLALGPDRPLAHVAVSDPLVGLATALALVALGRGEWGGLRAALSRRCLVSLGAVSYSLYLTHAPVVQLVWQYALRPDGLVLGDPATMVTLLASGSAASLAVAIAFHRLVERPCLPPVQPARARHAPTPASVPVSDRRPADRPNQLSSVRPTRRRRPRGPQPGTVETRS
jgi:peptidoglycan/LPS O-acetylase OafA/YrhL